MISIAMRAGNSPIATPGDHIMLDNLLIIYLGYGMSPVKRQAIAWTDADLLLSGALRTNSSEIVIERRAFAKMKCTSKWHVQSYGHIVSEYEKLVANYTPVSVRLPNIPQGPPLLTRSAFNSSMYNWAHTQ